MLLVREKGLRARVSERAVRKVTDISGQPKQAAPAVPVLPGLGQS
jgi:hypothetical protein